MNLINKIIGWFKKKLSNKFIQNLGWLGGAQAISRVSRLFTTVVLARYLTQEDYGLAALILATFEFTNVLSRFGIGAKIIQANEEELEDVCNGAYWLNWIMYLALFIIQCLASFPIAWFFNNEKLILPICVLSIVFLESPIGRIQSLLIQRENRLKITAVSQTLTLTTSNILSAIFALFGMGVWSIVVPKIISPLMVIAVYLKFHPWRPSGGFTTKYWREIFNYGINFLGINMLKTLRDNLDYLIVARFISVEALGVYYFAFNAGLGISLTIIQSITVALYPHLCSVRSNFTKFKQTYFSSLKTIATIIIPFVIFQASLAPFYVPIVFGEHWVARGAVPILVLVCLSAIPRPFDISAAQLLAAIDKPELSLLWSLIFTGIFTVGLMIGVQWQAIGVAIAVFITHAVALPCFVFWAIWYVFYRRRENFT